jgi:signal transduction histidine kinase
MNLLTQPAIITNAGLPLYQGGSLRSVTLAHAAEAQDARLRELGTQAAKIAHDLNNILSPIMMAVDMVRPHVADRTALKMLDLAKKSSHRAAELVGQILSFARGAEQKRTAVDAAAVVAEIATQIEETFPGHVQVKVESQPSLDKVSANATELHRVLLNLCVNARDAMAEGGTLTLRATNAQVPASPEPHGGARPGRYVMFEVSDTGSGIPEAIREKIFAPFFTTKAPGKGTGLGLASVRSIVEKHEGVLTLRTETGHGTTFSILLPAV